MTDFRDNVYLLHFTYGVFNAMQAAHAISYLFFHLEATCHAVLDRLGLKAAG